jgi:hypothetical protein
MYNNYIWVIEKLKSWKFTKSNVFFNSTFFSQSIIRIYQINILQLWNSNIKIDLGIFKYLISNYRNAQLQSIIQINVVIFK